ncbi:MAG: metallophosphoesterase [Candidatus Bathyarchaeia archaeon]
MKRSNAIRSVLVFFLAVTVLFVCYVSALQVLVREIHASNEATFVATELLGRPTDNSVTVNVIAEEDLEVYFEYGTRPGVYSGKTEIAQFLGGDPIEVVIDGLKSNTRYYYRMVYRKIGATEWIRRSEHSFHTQRAKGSTFTFTITSDSHLGFPLNLGNSTLYRRTMLNVLRDMPDFHIDLGDTFPMMAFVNDTAGASQVYLAQRPYLGLIGHSVPIFLVIGNHENEEGWNLDDTPSQPILSVNARKRYYPNPVPSSFYSGNTDPLAEIDEDHLREDYYAWQWGDALFVVIDPFWYTMTKPYVNEPGEKNDENVSGDPWDWTLGRQQYEWLKQTLRNSNAKFKFVFAHHVTGGIDQYGRGGAMAVPYFEWGGYDLDGSWGFTTRRPGWETPIHQLFIENNVTIFFCGHDHQYAKQQRDGIIYQVCPMPSDIRYSAGFNIYNLSNPYTQVVLNNSGHLRVTVSPTQVTVDYVRAYLSEGINGQVAYTYTIAPSIIAYSPAATSTPSLPEFPSPSAAPFNSPPPTLSVSPVPSLLLSPSPTPPISETPPITAYLIAATAASIIVVTTSVMIIKKILRKKVCVYDKTRHSCKLKR